MTERLKIGLDAKRIVRNGTGLGSYGRTLVNDLASYPLELRLYAPDQGRDQLRQQIRQQENVSFCYPAPSHLNVSFCYPAPSHLPFSKALWRSKGIVNDLKRDGIQVFHGLSGELPIGIRQSGIKSVVTIHDLIFLRHPEFYHWIDTKIYAWKFRQTIREANHIIAISECTKRDIMEYGEVDESRISLIYQSCAPKFNSAPTAKGGERYILSVGSIEARKNILLAVKALPYLPEEVKLVIVGRHTPYTDEVSAYAQKKGLSHRIRIMHGVSDEELPKLYAEAEAFVYPSRYEGFGIPIIEAISCGLPVVACTGSCLEEAGGPDSLYVDPDDAQAMAQAIRQVLRGAEGRDKRIENSQQYIKRFAGNDVAGQVAELYRQLL